MQVDLILILVVEVSSFVPTLMQQLIVTGESLVLKKAREI